jgi:condensin complex subunit 3
MSTTLDQQSPEEDRTTTTEEPSIKEEDEESEGTVIAKDERESLVDDLLSDEDVEMSGV